MAIIILQTEGSNQPILDNEKLNMKEISFSTIKVEERKYNISETDFIMNNL